MDFEYLKALSDMFASTDIENGDDVATQNKGEPSASLKHTQNAKAKTADINQPPSTSQKPGKILILKKQFNLVNLL
jgi:hypothetical protein